MQTMTTIRSSGNMPKSIDRHHTMRRLLNVCKTTDQFLKHNNDYKIYRDRNDEFNQTFHTLENKKVKKKKRIKVEIQDCMNSETGV